MTHKNMALNKKLMWMIVLWFAVLQTVTPFIHAHLESDVPDQQYGQQYAQQYGLHVHDQAMLVQPATEQAFDSVSAPPVHTIGVNEAVVEQLDLLPLPLFALLFVISLLQIALRIPRYSSIRQPLQSLHLRSLSRPRAPPLF